MVDRIKGLGEVNHKASNVRITFTHMYNIIHKTDQSTSSTTSAFECILINNTIKESIRA